MPIGEITKWNSDRGFGFLSDDDRPSDMRGTFVHITALNGRMPHIGETFEYEVIPTGDGRTMAANLRHMTAAREEVDRVFGTA